MSAVTGPSDLPPRRTTESLESVTRRGGHLGDPAAITGATRAELARRLPFDAEIMICRPRDVAVSQTPSGQPCDRTSSASDRPFPPPVGAVDTITFPAAIGC